MMDISADFGPLFHYQYRIILIGDSTVGKSSLLRYFTEGRHAEISDPTVGVDFYARMIEVKPGVRVKLQLVFTLPSKLPLPRKSFGYILYRI